MGVYEKIEDLYEVIRSKMRASRKADRQLSNCTGNFSALR